MLTWMLIGSVLLVVVLAILVALLQRADGRRNAQQHAQPPGTPPGAQPQPPVHWFTRSRKLVVTAAKEGAAIIVALVTLVVIYIVLLVAVPDFMRRYETGHEATKWLILLVVGAIALAAVLVGGKLRWVFVLPLLILLAVVVALPLTSVDGQWGGVDVTQKFVNRGCDEKAWSGVTPDPKSNPDPLPQNCQFNFDATRGIVGLEGTDGTEVDVEQGKATVWPAGFHALSIWAITPDAEVSGAFCPRERPFWIKNHCQAATNS